MGNGRLLLVDDEPELLEVIAFDLQSCGFEIETASNGAQALEKIEAQEPDAVLSDIQMPVMTGLTMVSTLRRTGRMLPVVFLSAFGDQANITQALRLGAVDFVVKPYDPETLCKTVKEAVTLGRSLKGIDWELQQYLEALPSDVADRERLMSVKRQLLIMKRLARGGA